jgi:translation initiation factor IF-1
VIDITSSLGGFRLVARIDPFPRANTPGMSAVTGGAMLPEDTHVYRGVQAENSRGLIVDRGDGIDVTSRIGDFGMLTDRVRSCYLRVNPVRGVAMYKEGDRVQVTSWQLDLQRTEVLTGTVETVGENNNVTVLMDNGESRHFHADEIQRIGP